MKGPLPEGEHHPEPDRKAPPLPAIPRHISCAFRKGIVGASSHRHCDLQAPCSDSRCTSARTRDIRTLSSIAIACFPSTTSPHYHHIARSVANHSPPRNLGHHGPSQRSSLDSFACRTNRPLEVPHRTLCLRHARHAPRLLDWRRALCAMALSVVPVGPSTPSRPLQARRLLSPP